ncbi:diadenosine tetraphosphatase [Steroidobacter denitrificans]|uniref:Bis(5'-nucleosyl)-tetraphosphatase, symmetrical n=1 Tax=Steroidobacter denitrificans TaxID=465721 RepID=A0A127F8E7_STEDE|nr:symmetrical bis(5'-nucleosyl)-tetraphosphatase [Steroidobacter denitrificans]AMN46702.1 diadenosine tetraphosphatase [Steroidobacter denitrificans]
MATYAIGDIQGCFQEFEQILDRLRFDPSQDRLWLVGDLVNRGPRSLEVLRKVRALGKAATTVLGNHDLHLLALASSPTRPVKAEDSLIPVLTAPDRAELLDWLRRQPLLHHDAGLGCTMIHAGLPPQWDLATARACADEVETALRDADQGPALLAAMYGNQPDRWSPGLQGMNRLRFITNCFTRLRYCRTDGSLELKFKGPPDAAPPGIMPWFRTPGRRSRELRIVCGHWSALGYHEGDGVLSIDTGCVWGQRLCAVRLDRPAVPTFVPCVSSGLSISDD